VGGGEWREGMRLAAKLGFSFPKMAPHAMDTILQAPQWPASLSQFVTWCLLWDPKARPTSSQALAHEYFADAVDPLRPRSSTSKILGRKQSDLSRHSKESTPASITSKPSWFRKSLIGRSETPEPKEPMSARAAPVQVASTEAVPALKQKRSTWTNGFSNVAPMPILPTIRPISPISDAVHARANNGQADSKKIGRQLSVASSTNNYAEMHRQQAERALNANTGLASPPSGQKEGFFSHLRKRARRFSGRHQTPVSPAYDDVEAQAGCGPWQSNRSSMVVDQQQSSPVPKGEVYESLDKALRDVQNNLDGRPPIPPPHQTLNATNLKRHHSLPHQVRSADNLIGAARAGPISSRTRRAQAVQGAQQYETPDEEEELLDEVLTSTRRAMKRMEQNGSKPLRQSASNLGLSNPYPTPSPSASGQVLFDNGQLAMTPKPLDLNKKIDSQYKWPTPPYEESEWAAAASASIWAASNRI
jgi:meiosis induction protein kinase IME2/SME1